MLASVATAPFRRFDSVKIVGPMAKGLAAVGGVAGALKGANEGWRRSKKPQKDPGLLKDYGNIKYLKQFKKELQNPKSQQYKDWVKEEMY